MTESAGLAIWFAIMKYKAVTFVKQWICLTSKYDDMHPNENV